MQKLSTEIIEVDLAGPDDEEEVMEMCWDLNRENGVFVMNEGCVRNTLRLAFEKQGGTIGVIRGNEKIEAMIFMLVARFWYSEEWHIEELFSYCRPEYRKSNNAKALIHFAKKCADELQVPLVIGVMSNTRTEAKVELYRRQLNKPAGAFFFYNTKWDKEQKEAVA